MTDQPPEEKPLSIKDYLEANVDFQRRFPSAVFQDRFNVGSDSTVGFFESEGRSYVLKVADGVMRNLATQVQADYIALHDLITKILDPKTYTSDVVLTPILWVWQEDGLSIMVQEHIKSDGEFKVNKLDGELEKKVENSYKPLDFSELELINRRIGNFAVSIYDFLIGNESIVEGPPFPLPDLIGSNPLGWLKSYDRSNYRNFVIKSNTEGKLDIYCIDPFAYFDITKAEWIETLKRHREQIHLSLEPEEIQ